MQPFSISSLGDNALVVSFGNTMTESVNEKLLQLFHRIKNCSAPFLDIVPGYCSLTVYYAIFSFKTEGKTAFETAKELVTAFINEGTDQQPAFTRSLQIPVCYAIKFAPDLEELAAGKNLPVEEVVRLHTEKTYRVYLVGFLPGFPYMGRVDSRIATPRKSRPRTAIPAGSVGIAGEQTGIYSLASPGGWNIIGRTPLQLFDKNRKEPVRLQPGDSIRFYSITEDEFDDYQNRLA